MSALIATGRPANALLGTLNEAIEPVIVAKQMMLSIEGKKEYNW